MIKNKTTKILYFWILIILLVNIFYFSTNLTLPKNLSLEDFIGIAILLTFITCGTLWPLIINFIFIFKFKNNFILTNIFTFLYGISYIYIHYKNYLNPSTDAMASVGLMFFGMYITQFLSIIWIIIFIKEKNIISKLKKRLLSLQRANQTNNK